MKNKYKNDIKQRRWRRNNGLEEYEITTKRKKQQPGQTGSFR
jgi:hypothetical protein